jgi:hypothetical protein
VPRTWPTVFSYAPWVEEVWVNYLSNALNMADRPDEGILPYVELGFSLPKIACRHQSPAPSKIQISDPFWVRDNGPVCCPNSAPACL